VLASGLYRLRFVTHLDVDAAGVDRAVAAMRGFFQG
jgi:threonine aldolase